MIEFCSSLFNYLSSTVGYIRTLPSNVYNVKTLNNRLPEIFKEPSNTVNVAFALK